MSRRPLMIFWLGLAALTSGCLDPKIESQIFYNISNLPLTIPGETGTHYEQFVEVDEQAIGRIGCFSVLHRQLYKGDVTKTPDGDVPTLSDVVSECECPCGEAVPDPLAPTTMISPGDILGTLDKGGLQPVGGVEVDTTFVLSHATGLFIVRKPNNQPDESHFAPGAVPFLGGELERSGDIIRGNLTSSRPERPTALVTVLPFEAGEPL